MATLLDIGGRSLAIDGDRFADPDAVTIDADLRTEGLHALPGLADCHAHLTMTSLRDIAIDADTMRDNAVRHAWMHVANGVLLVLDKGSRDEVSLEILDTAAERRPELQMAGRILTAPGGYFRGFAGEVDDTGLVDAVRAAAHGRARWVKIIGDWPRRGEGPRANFTTAALRAAVEVAHTAGCRVAVHTMAPNVASMVVDAGADSVEHGTFLTADDLAVLAARGGAWVPTVRAVERILEDFGPESTAGRIMSEGIANLRALLPEAERLGVTVLAGTDLVVPHGRVAVEAQRLHALGLSPRATVAAVSTAAYDYAGIDRGFAPGARADAVFFDRDPAEDLSVLGSPLVVIRRGALVVDRR